MTKEEMEQRAEKTKLEEEILGLIREKKPVKELGCDKLTLLADKIKEKHWTVFPARSSILTEAEKCKGVKGTNPVIRSSSMTKEEMEQLAEAVAEKIREDSATAVLILHSIPYAHGSPGIMVDPDIAARTPCKCYDNVCFSRGIIGSLSKPQREAYCPTVEHVTSPRMTKRLKNWQKAVDVCKAEIEPVPKGERLEPWLSCIGRELPKRGIEI